MARKGKITRSAVGQIIASGLFVLALFTGCSKNQNDKSTPTSGSLALFTSASIQPVIQKGADQFNRLYTQANVNVYSLESRAIVDSMINHRADVGYFDRTLSAEESLAVVATRKHLYSFLLGSTVATWIVNPVNQLAAIDSTKLLEIISGKTTTWNALGGSSENISVYLPQLGDGAWVALQDFFGKSLTKVEGHYLNSDSLVIDRVIKDPAALGLVSHPVSDSRIKKLKWQHPLLAESVPANVGSLQQGTYPFIIRLYYYTIADRTDLASGFLSFMAANVGQKIIADNGFLPGMVPVRVVTLTSNGDQK
jgi:phosphate transport system substrate-binding protein